MPLAQQWISTDSWPTMGTKKLLWNSYVTLNPKLNFLMYVQYKLNAAVERTSCLIFQWKYWLGNFIVCCQLATRTCQNKSIIAFSLSKTKRGLSSDAVTCQGCQSVLSNIRILWTVLQIYPPTQRVATYDRAILRCTSPYPIRESQ